MKKGFFLISRRLIDNELFKDRPDKWLKIFLYILTKVNFATSEKLSRGEGDFTYKEIMVATKCSEMQLRKCLQYLVREHSLSVKRNTLNTRIKVLKYAEYQDPSSYKEHPEPVKRNTLAPAKSIPERVSGSHNNGIKNKNIKKEIYKERKGLATLQEIMKKDFKNLL